MVTILELALHRGAQQGENGSVNGAEFDLVGLPIMGGCEGCGAVVAAYNAFPSQSGYLRCRDCICDSGWEDVERANADIFGGA